MNPTMDQFNALLARVNQLDGAGLPFGSQGQIAILTAQIAGLQQTVSQSVLAMEACLNQLTGQVAILQTAVNALGGVTG